MYVEVMRFPSGVVSQGNDVERKDKFGILSNKMTGKLKINQFGETTTPPKINLPLEKGPV